MSKRICFVTGTRAEFGLMRSVLEAIGDHAGLKLQIVATGMHTDRTRGNTLKEIRSQWRVDAVVPWERGDSPAAVAVATGRATARLGEVFARLKSDVVLVVGDRVEAFAAAAAGAIGGRVVAHVHGGDRALGQVDDSLRHAITKLAHVHFPATRQSARRIARLGEDAWRIHPVGSPGIDGIVAAAAWKDVKACCQTIAAGQYALVVLHPVDVDDSVEEKRARDALSGVLAAGIRRVVVIYPNTDPGSAGIIRAWKRAAGDDRCSVFANTSRGIFLGLLQNAAVLVGNSSAGIIEAASFGTPVVDVGPRQMGRERCADVVSVAYSAQAVGTAVGQIWNKGSPKRGRCGNPYGGNGRAGVKIADILGRLQIDSALLRKLITY